MTRRSPEVVDGALGFQHHGSPRDASYVWEALDILADEVRAQREVIVAAQSRLREAYTNLAKAEADIVRAEALVPAWRRKARELRGYDVGMHEVEACADELEAALKAKP